MSGRGRVWGAADCSQVHRSWKTNTPHHLGFLRSRSAGLHPRSQYLTNDERKVRTGQERREVGAEERGCRCWLGPLLLLKRFLTQTLVQVRGGWGERAIWVLGLNEVYSGIHTIQLYPQFAYLLLQVHSYRAPKGEAAHSRATSPITPPA